MLPEPTLPFPLDEENPFPSPAPVLSMAIAGRESAVIHGSAINDIHRSYSTHEDLISLEILPASDSIRGAMKVRNFGKDPSRACDVRFVLAAVRPGVPPVIARYRHPDPVLVPGSPDTMSPGHYVIEFELSLGKLQFLDGASVISIESFTHLHVMAFDPLKDPPSEAVRDLWALDLPARYITLIHPSRRSRLVRTICLHPSPFQLRGNLIELSGPILGEFSIDLIGGSGGSNLEIGHRLLIAGVNGQPQQVILGTADFAEGPNEFFLDGTVSGRIGSSQSGRVGCRLATLDGGHLLHMKWNDSDEDEDFNDFIVRVIAR